MKQSQSHHFLEGQQQLFLLAKDRGKPDFCGWQADPGLSLLTQDYEGEQGLGILSHFIMDTE